MASGVVGGTMTDEDRTVFVCPSCEATVAVTPTVRRTLIEEGCVFCGAPVSPGAFATPDRGDGHGP